MEFYPEIVAFEGTPFALNRIMLIRLLVLTLLVIVFALWTAKFKQANKTNNFVPGKFQLMGEISLNFVRKSIAHDQLGEKDGDRFLPLLTTIFFVTLGMNITGVIPGLNIAGTSVIGLPIVMALAAYVTFIYAGVKKHGGHFFTASLFPAGVPKAFYILVTPIEFLSTFILRLVAGSLFLGNPVLLVQCRRRFQVLRCRHIRVWFRVHSLRDPGRIPTGIRFYSSDHGLHSVGPIRRALIRTDNRQF
jgi:F-type H+-transporting ATPase subunit a